MSIWPNSYFRENDEFHRSWQEGPACIRADGSQEYWEHDKIHRPVSEGPARIYPNGRSEYWENDTHLWTVEP